MGETSFPQRKHLKRIPVWLSSDKPIIYFVTACCADRKPIFSNPTSVRIATEGMQRMETRLDWKVWKVCFMPDHVHLLLSPIADPDQQLSRFMQRWKTSAKLRLNQNGTEGEIWQREFFDRLLRSNEKLSEKWAYVRDNPVRAGLCNDPAKYPFAGTPEEVLENCRAGTPEGLPAEDRPN
jgi:putative transposase